MKCIIIIINIIIIAGTDVQMDYYVCLLFESNAASAALAGEAAGCERPER